MGRLPVPCKLKAKFENEPDQGFREPKKQLNVNHIMDNLYIYFKFYPRSYPDNPS